MTYSVAGAGAVWKAQSQHSSHVQSGVPSLTSSLVARAGAVAGARDV